MQGFLNHYFQISKRNGSIQTEIISGVTTFLAMCYILTVQPSLMKIAGMPIEAVMVSTALISGFATIAMGLYTNYPFALSAGMGSNIFFALTLVSAGIFSWQQGLSLVLIAGIIFFLMTVFNLRETIAKALPTSIKLGMGAVVGIFLIYLGLKTAGIISVDEQGFHLGILTNKSTLLSIFGLLFTIWLQIHKVRGSFLIGIMLITFLGIPFGLTTIPDQIFTLPPSIEPIFFKFDFQGIVTITALPILFIFFTEDFFNTLSTILGVSSKAGLLDKDGNFSEIEKPFLIDALSTIIGACFGLTTITTYVESSAGISEGGKTGLSAIITGICFLLTIFITPLFLMVPTIATAPCLIIIGFMLLDSLSHVNFGSLDETLPPLTMLVMTAFTASMANGIALGIILYTLLKIMKREWQKLSPTLIIITLMFVYYILERI